MASESDQKGASKEVQLCQDFWLPSKAFQKLEHPLRLEYCEEILRQCVVWGRRIYPRLQASDQQATACIKQVSAVVSDLESHIKYLREKEHGITDIGLKRVMAAAKSCFCHIQSSLQPGFIEGQDSHPEMLSLRWGLYSDELDELMMASESLLNELREDVPTGWRKSEIVAYANDQRTRPAPPQLYIGKVHSYRYSLEPIRDNLFPIKSLNQWVDLTEIHGWLDHCDKHHSHCNFSNQSKGIFDTLPKRLINVEQMCLIPVYSRQRYAALSYVWGSGPSFKTLKNNLSLLHTRGSLSGGCQAHTCCATTDIKYESGTDESLYGSNSLQLPRTITDTLHLTRRLGIKYLWIDALCIVQDDEVEKREQLTSMGSIYANAYITLVAAGGTAFSGLRGFEMITPPMQRSIRKPPKGVWRNPNLLLQREIRDHHWRIRHSTWSSRAWTFQEQIFSRRLLVLSNESVSWECHCAVWFEGIEAFSIQCRQHEKTIAQGFSFLLPPNLGDFEQHVKNYNLRKLTFPEDALRAFQGILGVLNTAFVGGFVCGIPRMFFDRGLLWWVQRDSGPARRRFPSLPGGMAEMPPTWSWAAWEGEIRFPSNDANNHSLVQWKFCPRIEDGWSVVVSADGETRGKGSGNCHGTALDGLAVLQLAEHQRSNLLLARPDMAFFRLATRHNGILPWNDYWGTPIVGKDGICAGKMKALEWIDFNTPTGEVPCELIAVSGSTEGQYYNVLWIEWHDGVALRKGVGRVWKSSWEEADPSPIALLLR
jgi:hypothetical protein